MWNEKGKIVKPIALLLGMGLLISLSMLGVTLGMYVKEIRLFDGGWVGPKYYAFEVESVNQHQSIAPGKSVDYSFTISNQNDGGVAQVPLQVAIAIQYPKSLAGSGKLRAELRCGDTSLGQSDTGELECNGLVLSSNVRESDVYTLTLTWLEADMVALGEVASAPFDPSQISIRVSGYQ